jgi:hypothetical protein
MSQGTTGSQGVSVVEASEGGVIQPARLAGIDQRLLLLGGKFQSTELLQPGQIGLIHEVMPIKGDAEGTVLRIALEGGRCQAQVIHGSSHGADECLVGLRLLAELFLPPKA